MNNQILYDKYQNCPINFDKMKEDYEDYERSLNLYYGDLLPLEHIDTHLESLILNSYLENVFHGRYMVSNMKKTSQSFKDKTSKLLLFLFIPDISIEEIMRIFASFKDQPKIKNMADADLYSNRYLYDISRNFSAEEQKQLIGLNDENIFLIKMIKNPSHDLVERAINKSHEDMMAYITTIENQIAPHLYEVIRQKNNKWFLHVKNWTQNQCTYIIDDLINPEKTHMKKHLDFFFVNRSFLSEGRHCLATIILDILKDDKISPIDLYRLEKSPLGKEFFLNEIKSNKNYKNLASIVLEEIKESIYA